MSHSQVLAMTNSATLRGGVFRWNASDSGSCTRSQAMAKVVQRSHTMQEGLVGLKINLDMQVGFLLGAKLEFSLRNLPIGTLESIRPIGIDPGVAFFFRLLAIGEMSSAQTGKRLSLDMEEDVVRVEAPRSYCRFSGVGSSDALLCSDEVERCALGPWQNASGDSESEWL
mmetsp:Transcript_98475/g.303557  ORF Transcript_98475/g.303557 Transcript_98475/m.303557 type:complete len:170 (-) Transcript_98475:358-867(-)